MSDGIDSFLLRNFNGAKRGSSGDETPPITEEELEQQKFEHERQIQKEKMCQAKEAEEVAELDFKLLRQRAIEAQDEQHRENAEHVQELRGLKPSWSHHSRLCDLQHQAVRWRHSRPSIPDTTRPYRDVIKKSTSAQLTKPQSSQSIANDGISGYSDLRRGLIVCVVSCAPELPPATVPSPRAKTPVWVTQICKKCPRIYLPVCGNDSKTYTNECKLNCLNYEFMKDPPVVVERKGLCEGYP